MYSHEDIYIYIPVNIIICMCILILIYSALRNEYSEYCGFVIVRGGLMFVDFVGYLYPRIYVHTNVSQSDELPTDHAFTREMTSSRTSKILTIHDYWPPRIKMISQFISRHHTDWSDIIVQSAGFIQTEVTLLSNQQALYRQRRHYCPIRRHQGFHETDL